jgi:hypothetical protein
VRALYELLEAAVGTAEEMRERLRRIIAPERSPLWDGRVPRLD